MKRFLLLIFSLAEFGCQESRDFEFMEAQPSGVSNERVFNKKYQGVYEVKSDSSNFSLHSELVIFTDKILSFSSWQVSFTRNEIDSSFTGDRNNDEEIKAFMIEDGCREVKMKGDSIFAIWADCDTVFSFSEDNVCRYLKGAYFLNFKKGPEAWKVKRLVLEKGRLSVSEILPNDSLFQSMSLNEKKVILDDSGKVGKYKIRPSKKELKKLIKDEAFSECEVWTKIK